MIAQYADQSAAVRKSVIGQAESQYILCNVLIGVSMCQSLQVPTVHRVSSPSPSAASESQIWIITTRGPTNLSQYSLTDLNNVSPNL